MREEDKDLGNDGSYVFDISDRIKDERFRCFTYLSKYLSSPTEGRGGARRTAELGSVALCAFSVVLCVIKMIALPYKAGVHAIKIFYL